MNREGKKVIVAELKDKFQKCQGMVFADFIGMSVNQMEDLRLKARDLNVEIKVVKNTLAKKAYDIFEDKEGLYTVVLDINTNNILGVMQYKSSRYVHMNDNGISNSLTDIYSGHKIAMIWIELFR